MNSGNVISVDFVNRKANIGRKKPLEGVYGFACSGCGSVTFEFELVVKASEEAPYLICDGCDAAYSINAITPR